MEHAKADVGGSPTSLTLKQQLAFWSASLVVFLAFLWLLADVLLPFVAGMVLAYLLNPIVERLQGLGLPRIVAALLILVIAIAALVVAAMTLAPLLAQQIAEFGKGIPADIEKLQKLFDEFAKTWLGQAVREQLPKAQESLGGIAGSVAGWFTGFLASLWSGGKAFISVISIFVIAPIVAFYLLLDWDRLVTAVDTWIPRPQQETVRQIMRDIDAAVSGFLRGQAMCCLILGTFYAISLKLIGLNFGILIGLTAGALGFIPYLGPSSGFLMATGMATAQFWPEWLPIMMCAGVFVVGQMVEGNVLQPYLVGSRTGLHPVWLMFALFAFGYLFGFVGLLVAVPVAAAIGVIIRFLFKQYLASPYYRGG
jgi:predicted PurR-regulated permease PerM